MLLKGNPGALHLPQEGCCSFFTEKFHQHWSRRVYSNLIFSLVTQVAGGLQPAGSAGQFSQGQVDDPVTLRMQLVNPPGAQALVLRSCGFFCFGSPGLLESREQGGELFTCPCRGLPQGRDQWYMAESRAVLEEASARGKVRRIDKAGYGAAADPGEDLLAGRALLFCRRALSSTGG